LIRLSISEERKKEKKKNPPIQRWARLSCFRKSLVDGTVMLCLLMGWLVRRVNVCTARHSTARQH
jgi:hypothetical protein